MSRTFLRPPEPQDRRDRAAYVVLPLPYEGTVSYGRGASAGPAAVLDASAQLEHFDEELLFDASGAGVHTAAPVVPRDGEGAGEYLERVADAARAILADGRFLIGLGGEHSVTVPLVRALRDSLPGAEPLGVLQVDAHGDLRDRYDGSPHSHACVMRRLHADLGLPIAPVGIRSFCEEEHDYMRAHSIEPVTPVQIESGPGGDWIGRALDRLPERIYITLDIDGLDPSIAPGTGTPEPGGLRWRDLACLLRAACTRKQVLAADLVEVAPIPGQQVTEFTAARLLYKLITYREHARGGA